KDAYRISSPCYPQFQLHKLCAEGKAGPFNDYVRFLKRKSDGEFVSEASDKYRQVRYYNVKPDTLFPLEPIEFGDGVRSLGIKVDNTALHSLRHVSIGASSYPSYFMIGLMFREPWSKIV